MARRTEGCAFDTGVWTNLTQDHLDAHGTMDAYFAEKLRLFTEYPDAFPDKPFSAVVNADDAYGLRVAETMEAAGRPVLRYALHDPDAALRAEVTEVRPDGTNFTVHYQPPQGSAVVVPHRPADGRAVQCRQRPRRRRRRLAAARPAGCHPQRPVRLSRACRAASN